jgi:rhodanese-related sulfurtransferase
MPLSRSPRSPSMGLRDLEQFYDGPIPAEAKRAALMGGALARDIADLRREIVFYRRMFLKSRAAARSWAKVTTGNPARVKDMVDECNRSAIVYLDTGRRRRAQLAELLAQA